MQVVLVVLVMLVVLVVLVGDDDIGYTVVTRGGVYRVAKRFRKKKNLFLAPDRGS